MCSCNVCDVCRLPELNPPALLHFLHTRFLSGNGFFTAMSSDALLWTNPCAPVPELWTTQQMRRAALARAPMHHPHAFALAERARRSLLSSFEPRTGAFEAAMTQALVVTGVSGAGKSAVCEQLVRYCLWRCAGGGVLRTWT